jgi:hypothetical protein
MKASPAIAIAIACISAFVAGARAQTASPFSMARSVSGQFVVVDVRNNPGQRPSAWWLGTNASLLPLEPSFLAVSAERIKQELQYELGADTSWRGKIQLVIRPAQSDDEMVRIVSERFSTSWGYRVELPHYIERTRFVRSMVQVLLQEMANRNAGERSAEIPAWLIEGLAQQVARARGGSLLLAPPTTAVGSLMITPTVTDASEHEYTRAARRILRENTPLTIEQLSWPANGQVTNAVYQLNAQVFVMELLRLENGAKSLRRMIANLGQCYNWQTAFFSAFNPHFTRQLDLEKWWALQMVNFTGRDIGQFWTVEESQEKIGQVLRAPVALRRSETDAPAYAGVALQTVIREWDMDQQTWTLRQKVRELEIARLRVSPDFMAWVQDYKRVLEDYLLQRERSSISLADARNPRPATRKLVKETCVKLDNLDRRLAEIHPQTSPNSNDSESGKPVGLTATGSKL